MGPTTSASSSTVRSFVPQMMEEAANIEGHKGNNQIVIPALRRCSGSGNKCN